MRRVHYAWVVATVGFVTLITAAGFRSSSGVLIVPLQHEFGWSRGLIGVALAINLVLYGLAPYGTDVADPAPTAAGNPFAAAVDGLRFARTSTGFWLLAGSFFICGLSTNGLIGTHLIPAAMDHGFGEVAAAGLLATIGVFDIVGTT